MKWIRIDLAIGTDPSVVTMAHQLGIPVAQAVGHLTLTLTNFPTHARNGVIADIHDAALEMWALWGGETGAFAREFRARLCDERGKVRAWDKINGEAIRKADKDLRRLKKWRADRDKHRDAERGVTRGVERVRNANDTRIKARDGTGRDGTGSKDQEHLTAFDTAWAKYPTRPNNPKRKALSAFAARVAEGVDPAELIAGVERYAAYVEHHETEPRFVLQAATFFAPDRRFAEPWPVPQMSEARRRELGLDESLWVRAEPEGAA